MAATVYRLLKSNQKILEYALYLRSFALMSTVPTLNYTTHPYPVVLCAFMREIKHGDDDSPATVSNSVQQRLTPQR